VIALELADLVVIAGRTLGLDTGQVLDLLDPEAAEHALAMVRAGGGPGDPAGLTATLLHALVREQPLRHGNQQVALAAMLQFLALNGWDLDPDPPEAIAGVVADLAAGARNVRQVADWLAPRLRPGDRVGASVREEQIRRGSARLLAERLKRATMRAQPTGRLRRFTDRARRAVRLAQEEALLLRHGQVGTEHLVLGLLYEGEGVAARALESLGISLDEVRTRVEEIIGRGQDPPAGPIPFTPQAKKVLELSLREALALGHHYVGTEHLLLGLLGEGESMAAQVLARLGADHARVRERVLAVLTGECEQTDPQSQLIRLALPDDVLDAGQLLANVRRQKQAAFDAGGLDAAKVWRDWERQLLVGRQQLRPRLEDRPTAGAGVAEALAAENQRLHHELDRLRGLLRGHGIEPDEGAESDGGASWPA
jgi:prophage maintenance system killer protein